MSRFPKRQSLWMTPRISHTSDISRRLQLFQTGSFISLHLSMGLSTLFTNPSTAAHAHVLRRYRSSLGLVLRCWNHCWLLTLLWFPLSKKLRQSGMKCHRTFGSLLCYAPRAGMSFALTLCYSLVLQAASPSTRFLCLRWCDLNIVEMT